VILFGEAALCQVLANCAHHHHEERSHQGQDNVIFRPWDADPIGRSAEKYPNPRAVRRSAEILSLGRRLSLQLS
jgi:hypothetical protein